MFDLTALEEAAGKAADLDATLASGDALLDVTARLQRCLDQLHMAQSALLAAIEDRSTAEVEFGLSTSGWLAHTTEQSPKACGARVKRATALHTRFSVLWDALLEGRVSWEQAQVILGATNPRNRDAMIASVPLFLAWADALHGKFKLWAEKVRQYANDLDQDGPYDPNDDLHANRLDISELPDATRELRGRLVGATGVTVKETLESIADELYRAFSEAHNQNPAVEVPARRTLMALALEELCRRAKGRPPGSTVPPRTEAVIVIQADHNGNPVITTPSGDRVPASAADALLWDANVRALLLDQDGCPLHLGRSTRLATRDQRLAMAIRDTGCIYPGCDRPPNWTHAHHVEHWQDGGETDLSNMASLCGRHHGTVHQHRWHMKPDPDRAQQWEITTPMGRVLNTQRNHE